MQQMFQSATLKLTAAFLAIVMAISITFSVVIYQISSQEISNRLQSLESSIIDEFGTTLPFNDYGGNIGRIGSTDPSSFLVKESKKASLQIVLSLIYINVCVFIIGGLCAYFLAKRTLQPIADAHEAQSRFTSDASHELRTPLAAMKTELEVSLRDKNLPADEAREILESNLEEVNKLIRLSEMLLKLSRLEHDNLEVTRVDLPKVLEETLKLYPDEKNRFVIEMPKKAATRANQPAVSELVSILIDNAIKYSPKSTPITIRIFTQRGTIGFEIANAGKKIPEELLPKLFNRFFQADSSRTNSAKNGYGLGLSIAKKIVDLHHGSISVTSTDELTTFTVLLPIVRNSSVEIKNN